jgi:RNA polymerase sigma factor (sigma-70 family)
MVTGRLRGVIRTLRKVSLSANSPPLTDGELLQLFISRRDESAFEALLRRHGPMVLATCRRLLVNAHDAEDAFQATFLILVRKATSIVPRDMVGNWLYGVACRAALKVKTAAARRRVKESNVPRREPAPDNTWNDLLPLLDAELGRLPQKYRVAVVLCDLEGKSRTEAARQLGLPVGTLSTRVMRGRALLAKKLARHGLGVSAGALAMSLTANAGPACLPVALAAKTLAAAALYAGKKTAAAMVSANVLTITEGVLKSMLLKKLNIATAVLLALTMIGTGAGFFSVSTSAGDSTGRPGREAAQLTPQVPPNSEETWFTENFAVHAPTLEAARRVGRAAERYRKEQALAWLGKELPRWSERCPIDVKIRPGSSERSTTFAFYGGSVVKQHMNLQGSLTRILQADLPHQMAHVVFSNFFKCPVPRWADSGAATLSSDNAERNRHEEELLQALNSPKLFFSLNQLFTQRDYPKDVALFFAESYSISRFLVDRNDRRTFVRFVAQGMRDGWDEAVRTHYDFANAKELQRAWLRSIAKSSQRKSAPGEPVNDPEHDNGSATGAAWRVMGLELEVAGRTEVETVNRQLQGGLRVIAVRPHSTAAVAGIRPGDILVGLHQWETLDLESVPYAIAYCQGAKIEPVSFYIVRNKQVRRGSFSLAEERPESRRMPAMDQSRREPVQTLAEARREVSNLMRRVEEGDRQTVLEILGAIEKGVRDLRKKLERTHEQR